MLSENEKRILTHISRWGSDGYPIHKSGNKWMWVEFFGINGAPTIYKTKKEAFAAFEIFLDVLRDKAAGRIT